ncbi:hypothetical protein CBER1_03066 [Cercospora berteroae]|uniref:Uncharacterized protein n=1 Tax=Cercospora berteroae TaxID=357750 RepID=A0A2S6CHE0_9PEZI|nr:hypothetical protein CBER1_03066 [Cercospora berteroae]
MVGFHPLVLAVFYSSLTLALPLVDDATNMTLYERQGPGTGGPCGDTTFRTELVGNGNPHQNFKQVQITGTLNCGGGGGCEKSKMESETIAIGFEAGGGEWITGGFSVTKEYTTGETDTCYGEDGENLCIWQRIHHTAYTVEESRSNRCDGVVSRQFVMKSPNSNQPEGPYCVRGSACRTLGAFYWEGEETTIPGGPP